LIPCDIVRPTAKKISWTESPSKTRSQMRIQVA